MTTTIEAAKEQLESLIDAKRLSKVVSLISEICSEKAEHIRDNWQDGSRNPNAELIRAWIAASNQLESLEQKIYRAGL